MGKQCPRLAILWFVLLSFSVVVSAQSSQSSDKPKRSVPKLTNDDLQPSPWQPVAADLDATSPPRPSPGKGVESGGGIQWHRDPHEAANLASPGNKLIIVDVFTDWCGWCKKMD